MVSTADRSSETRPSSATVFLTPVMPGPSGTGLAMRAGVLLRSLARLFDVSVIVVPVSGYAHDAADWASGHAKSVVVLDPRPSERARLGTIELVKSAAWRARLAALEPAVPGSHVASPALAATAAEALAGVSGPVHVLRSYLAPLGVALAEQIDAPWLAIDLDDDDEALAMSMGAHERAAEYHRILEAFGPEFAWVTLASSAEAEAIATRHGLTTSVLANTIDVSPRGSRHRRERPPRLLLVGNLTYEPNAEAARILADDVLPHVRRRSDPHTIVRLVGGFDDRSGVEHLGEVPGVELIGFADELGSHYEASDVAVAPIRHGGGTRIKVLEALAYEVPVVATTTACSGLAVVDGTHLLIAERPRAIAAAVERVLSDPALADRLVQAGVAFVREHHSPEVAFARVEALTASAQHAAGGPG